MIKKELATIKVYGWCCVVYERKSFIPNAFLIFLLQSCESADPTSNLTFNLRLTDAERQAKSNTVLPYILNDDNKSAMLVGDGGRTAKGGGEIIYTPDDFDDFDDEDPDDDLDI